jgi:hypothetical protein
MKVYTTKKGRPVIKQSNPGILNIKQVCQKVKNAVITIIASLIKLKVILSIALIFALNTILAE